jgi:phage terminase large subunit-like protein
LATTARCAAWSTTAALGADPSFFFREFAAPAGCAVDDEAAWERCADPSVDIPDGAEVVLGFDGSFSGDCSALVAVTVADRPHVHLVQLWEAPEGSRDWRVPVVEVEDAIRAACRRWRVLEVAADPYRWPRSRELLDGEGIPVGEYPQSPARMGPATARF